MKNSQFNRIEGLEGAIPFGGIVSTGVKGSRGNPERTDRFFILATGFEDVAKGRGASFRNLRHPGHPDFAAYNAAPDSDKRTTVIRGNLVFPDRDDGLNIQLAAQQLGKGNGRGPTDGGTWETPPRSMPACTGNGSTASRFDGMEDGKPVFVDIPCPNRLCQFRQGSKKICGALGRLYFLLRWDSDWPGFPGILVRYQTHGWDTCENLKGMFDSVEGIAAGLCMDPDAWGFTGLPFEMSVGIKKIPDKGHSFPVVSFALGDVPEFLRWQVDLRQTLLAAPRSVALLGDGMEHEEASPEGIGAALAVLTPGIPSGVTAAIQTFNEPGPVETEKAETMTRQSFGRLKSMATDCGTTIKAVFAANDWELPESMGTVPAADYEKIATAIVAMSPATCEGCEALPDGEFCSDDCRAESEIK